MADISQTFTNSKYEDVNKLITNLLELMNDPSKIKPIYFDKRIYPNSNTESILLRYKSLNTPFEIGSGRITFIFESLDLVVKLPYNSGGYSQNQRELEFSNLDEYTDVLESHTLFGKKNFILVNPYYKPVMKRFDELISEVALDYPPTCALEELFSYENLEDVWSHRYEGVDYDLLDYAVQIVAETQYLGSKFYQRPLEFEEPMEDVVNAFWEIMDDESFGKTLADHFDNWVDTNCENFGITKDNTYIMLDSGVQSSFELDSIFNEENNTDYNYSNLILN